MDRIIFVVLKVGLLHTFGRQFVANKTMKDNIMVQINTRVVYALAFDLQSRI